MKEVDVVRIKRELNKYVVKSPLATRIDVINRTIMLIEDSGFTEMPIELLKFVMAIPLEVNVI